MGTYGLKGIIEAGTWTITTSGHRANPSAAADLHERITALEKEARAKTKLNPPHPTRPRATNRR
jgi:hypothetical protein